MKCCDDGEDEGDAGDDGDNNHHDRDDGDLHLCMLPSERRCDKYNNLEQVLCAGATLKFSALEPTFGKQRTNHDTNDSE